MRILIVDDYPSVRDGLRVLLNSIDDVQVCGEAVHTADAVSKARKVKPDVIVMELGIPAIAGIRMIEEIRRTFPHVRVVIVSQFESPEIVHQARNAGASAYVAKTSIWNVVPVLRQLSFDTKHRTDTANPKQDDLAQAKLELQVATTQIEMIADRVHAPLSRCSRDLRYQWVNQHYADWMRRPIDQILGRKIVDVIGKDAFDTLSDRFDRVLGGNAFEYEELVNFESIGDRRIWATYRPSFSLTGKTDGWLAFVQDLS